MGGQKYSKQHAINSAKLANETQPHFLATLVLFFSDESDKVGAGLDGELTPPNNAELSEEMRLFIKHPPFGKIYF